MIVGNFFWAAFRVTAATTIVALHTGSTMFAGKRGHGCTCKSRKLRAGKSTFEPNACLQPKQLEAECGAMNQ